MTDAVVGGGSRRTGHEREPDPAGRPDLHARVGTGHRDDEVTTVIHREGGSGHGSKAGSAGVLGGSDLAGIGATPQPEGSPPAGQPALASGSSADVFPAGVADDDALGGDLPLDGHPPDDVPGPDPVAERAVLLDLLIYAWDRARSAGVWERLTAGLTRIGVEVIRPDGEIFDPTCHEVGGVEETTDPLLHNTIAETESAGFRDRGRLIREPVVVVYRVS
ncbi:hypothetical protein ABIB25_002644 [Nakamurella sp. UYEF19]|uniref:nucleotide exchange factor GrpE n=1 Tax=Nakamurella sp. UYEF19 TaxID=1756392 RepID=UPI00339232B7